ncbi:MAG: tRNA-specific 2-thiouridylase MnmA [Berkelbacteria bacterium GW2011_GWA2_35_9]|uniref:tRNA-specific 2-thiouridylase MnmA n=1 Tax=Berkelbacteria bacterium GW2011_GWA2_35_9 TaxID=1618333 RepID=A0A0G0D407_9BACT|nr:MAG: tRNA-specific 2-thiouridylase MnmA [Berkelbacteria bacterium GW2011_GWA2_35_9]
MKSKKAVIALSGGVDSAVSALLLKKAGFDLTAVFLKNFDIKSWLTENNKNEKFTDSCSDLADQKMAERVANFLDIPFYVLNFEKEYAKNVFSKFIKGYEKGITPNPDVWCNTFIKFGALLKFVEKISPNAYLATGHYARLRRANLKFQISNLAKYFYLLRGVDPSKDQAYFLWQLGQKQLEKVIFPIGGMMKTEVREIAKKNRLPNATKKDSQGICFVGKLPLKEFLKMMIKPKIGDVVLSNNTKVGEHDGAFYYTIGERISASEVQSSKFKVHNKFQNSKLLSDSRKALYVIYKDIENNKLVVDFDETQISEISNFKIQSPNKFQNPKFKIQLNETVRAITPGQHVVFYRGDEVLGGAIISN